MTHAAAYSGTDLDEVCRLGPIEVAHVKFCTGQGLHKDNHRFLGRATVNNHERYATL
jgi:hypothetical protein